MNQRIGYARVSTEDQHLDLQRDALQQAGCRVIYEETASGKNAARPELEQCRKALRSGDTLVVWRLDRLGRSLPDLVHIVADLERGEVSFESLSEKIEWISRKEGYDYSLSGCLAASHLCGVEAVFCYLKSESDAQDETGTSLQAYLKRFSGFELNVISEAVSAQERH